MNCFVGFGKGEGYSLFCSLKIQSNPAMRLSEAIFCRFVLLALIVCSCSVNKVSPLDREGVEWAEWFDIVPDGKGGESLVILSPYTGKTDTVKVSSPMGKFVCMSSSYIAYLDAVGADSTVVGVSGIDYISNPDIQKGYSEGRVFDIGYDANPDYERIATLSPDLVVCYMVSSSEPPFIGKLRSLGIPVLVIYEHLENHPLARAEYVKLFGYLTGRLTEAMTAFGSVETDYISIRDKVKGNKKAKALLNIPYGDQWFIPGGDNYMSVLIGDAGGEVLGAVPGETSSSVISMEKAYTLSQEADFWLNTGWCDTMEQLHGADPMFRHFPIEKVFNNTLRVTPGGGNDFWESGAFRADLVLGDLAAIFSGDTSHTYSYYREVK